MKSGVFAKHDEYNKTANNVSLDPRTRAIVNPGMGIRKIVEMYIARVFKKCVFSVFTSVEG